MSVVTAAQSTEDFDALYAAHSRRLTLQLYAYLGDLGEAQDRALATLPETHRRAVVLQLAVRTKPAATAQLRGDDALIRALATLPIQDRRVVILHYLAKLSTSPPMVTAMAETPTTRSGPDPSNDRRPTPTRVRTAVVWISTNS